MPAIDILEEGNDLIVTIDLPGFAKKEILISELSSMSYT
jgi:HSP20 family molecular chaperone IbpA